MRLGSALTLGGTALAFLATVPAALAAPNQLGRPSPGGDGAREIIVRFQPGAGPSERSSGRRAAGVQVRRGLKGRTLRDAQVVAVPAGERMRDAIARLERHPAVRYAEPNRFRRAYATPNDPKFAGLWGLHNTGQAVPFPGGLPGTPDADIDAPEAWDTTTGSPGVVVAVTDEGVDLTHPDLDGNLWTNPGEVPGNGADDDGNGWVDDVHGIDVVDGDSDPRDFGGHGTHVAGTIGAEGSNGVGVAGVAWDVSLMAVRVLGGAGGTDAEVAEGFDYAGAMGARVVNASLGGPGFSQTILDAIQAHPDTLFVVAAGNDGHDNDNTLLNPLGDYPCNYPVVNVICVAATGPDDDLASFSNYGAKSVDIGAPGVEILSTEAEREDVLTDTFDDETAFEDDWNGWIWTDGAGDGEATDSSGPIFDYAPSTEDILAQAGDIDLTARVGCVLGFDLYAAIEPPAGEQIYDALWIERSVDGGSNWLPLAVAAGFYDSDLDGPVSHLDLQADGQADLQLRFRLTSDETVEYDGATVDNLTVTCRGPYSDDSYVSYDGTSMATPHVAGAAALLLSRRPDLPVRALRHALLTQGDPRPDLAGLTTTGMRLNADRALDRAGLFPEVLTGGATGIGPTTATLTGTVDPRGIGSSYRFDFGPTTGYGQSTPLTGVSGSGPVSVSADLSGLAPQVLHHARLVAVQDGVEIAGQDITFSTTAPVDPPVTPPTTPPAENPVALMRRTARVSCRRLGRRLSCRFTATGARSVRGTVRNRRGRVIGRYSGRTGKRIVFRVRRLRRGRYVFRVAFTDAQGNRATVRRRVRIR